MTAREKVAEILRCSGVLLPNDYTPTWDYARKIDELATELADAAIAAHLEALGAGGYVVVKLPEPQEQEAADLATWWDRVGELRVSVHDHYPGEVAVSYDFEPYEPLSVAEARSLAAALLAAAAKAEAS